MAPRTDGLSGKPGYRYTTTELPGLHHLVGRAVVQFKKTFRASYLRPKSVGVKLTVSEIRKERMSVGDFPGYNGVLLSHQVLRTVVREEIPRGDQPLAAFPASTSSSTRQMVGSMWAAFTEAPVSGSVGRRTRVMVTEATGN